MKGNLRLVSWVLALLENSCGSGRLSLGSLDLSACRSITRSKLLISEVVAHYVLAGCGWNVEQCRRLQLDKDCVTVLTVPFILGSTLIESNSNSSGMLSRLALLFFLLTVTTTLVPGSCSISLGAVAPADFYIGDPLQVEVSNLTSPDTRLSYDFYSIRYCKPSKTLRKFLQGEAFQGSVYTEFGNLPVTQRKQKGFRVGLKGTYYPVEEVYFIHNHLSFRVMYHKNPRTDSAQIAGFEVDPYSSCSTRRALYSFLSIDWVINVLIAILWSAQTEYEGPWNEKNPQLLTCNPRTNGIHQAFAIPQRIGT
ncbi:Transmembrane nine 7-like protein [Theobroma cacao]|uniref:Transmembrane nine 7-like protein n=1 Tax=Theobroma cacao TaxID=3641 RepID=A0A061GM12_THECC|nr:Transmembrane nine 7-like protein [Theobroma cacao]